MNLVLDIGNTRTKVAVFDDTELLERTVWDNWTLTDLQKYMESYPLIQRVAVSTVTYIWEEVENFLREHFFYIHLTHETPIPIKNAYATPETLGKDRLAGVIGARHLYPNQNCLVIDAGTCIKYDILLAKGIYLGGNIAPGIRMRLKAMHKFTAKLPEIEPDLIADLVGDTTETALRTGGQLGAIMETRAFIEAYGQKFGSLRVLMTGGDTNYFVKDLKKQIFVHPNLILVGLNKILNYNAKLLKVTNNK